MFAISKAILGEFVDIITSSSVLAERDATNIKNKKLYEAFDLTVSDNCNKECI